jgi:hypothetical protein
MVEKSRSGEIGFDPENRGSAQRDMREHYDDDVDRRQGPTRDALLQKRKRRLTCEEMMMAFLLAASSPAPRDVIVFFFLFSIGPCSWQPGQPELDRFYDDRMCNGSTATGRFYVPVMETHKVQPI